MTRNCRWWRHRWRALPDLVPSPTNSEILVWYRHFRCERCDHVKVRRAKKKWEGDVVRGWF
jgi:hypothetical protein